MEATHRAVVFMCLGADIEIVIPESDGTPFRRGISVRMPARNTSLFQFGLDTSASVCIESGACTKTDTDDLRIKLTHGDLLMLSGGDRKVRR